MQTKYSIDLKSKFAEEILSSDSLLVTLKTLGLVFFFKDLLDSFAGFNAVISSDGVFIYSLL